MIFFLISEGKYEICIQDKEDLRGGNAKLYV